MTDPIHDQFYAMLKSHGYRRVGNRLFKKAGGHEVVASRDGHSVYAANNGQPVRMATPGDLEAFLGCIHGAVCKITRRRR